MRTYRPKELKNKSTILTIASAFIALMLVLKLFQLQVLAHDYYQDIASREQYGIIELPAQRGEIFITDYHSGEEFLIATNTTLNMLYADPFLVDDPVDVGEKLAPLLFDLETEREKDNERIKQQEKELPPDLTEEEIEKLLAPKSDEELESLHKQNLIDTLSAKQRSEILLVNEIDKNRGKAIQALGLPGVKVVNNQVYAYPPEITNPGAIANQLADYIDIPASRLQTILLGNNRYSIIAKKLDPQVSDEISKFKTKEAEEFRGIGLNPEYFRFYPEGTLASNILGFTNKDNDGQYGIEKSFNVDLKGQPGKFQTKKDSVGRQITVGESIIEPAVNGDDIILTIDRSVQLTVEQILADAVTRYWADSGQIIVMDPKTGAIIALANYPTFDPNNFGDVFELEEFNIVPEDMPNLKPATNPGEYNFMVNERTGEQFKVFERKQEDGSIKFFRYKNYVGPEVYHNKAVSFPYEPGSVFKSVAMAIGIDADEVTPNTTYNDTGPIKVDWNPYTERYDFEIKNSDRYMGLVDMTTVLAESLNTGMTFIAQKMGPNLFYSYLEKFGFLEKTNIEFNDESPGKVQYWEDWSESELATHSFGQGISVNMIQMANAYSVLANGGILMQPHIVKEVRHDDGTVTQTEPREIRRVISEETSTKMTAMLTYSTEKGVANEAQVEDHLVAGKTGTSQTYRYGRALSGVGTTIASFAGYGPVNDPQFVVLVKLDKPKSNQWGSKTAAPTFRRVANYLYEYYNIPPDK